MAETRWLDGPRRKSLDKAEDFRQKGQRGRWKKMQRIQISEDQGDTYEAKKRAKEQEDTSGDTTISVADQGVKEGAIDVDAKYDWSQKHIPIGTWDGQQYYSGPLYGWKPEAEYKQLLQSGKLGRGQQATTYVGEKLVEHGKDIIPDKVKGVVTGGGHLLRDFANSKVGQVAGKAWEFSGLETQVKQTMQVIDAPATGIAWVSKKVDPTGRGIGKAPIQVAEAFVPGVGPAKKVAKKGLKYSDEVIDALTINKQ